MLTPISKLTSFWEGKTFQLQTFPWLSTSDIHSGSSSIKEIEKLSPTSPNGFRLSPIDLSLTLILENFGFVKNNLFLTSLESSPLKLIPRNRSLNKKKKKRRRKRRSLKRKKIKRRRKSPMMKKMSPCSLPRKKRLIPLTCFLSLLL